MPLVKLMPVHHTDIAKANALCFGKKDQYSDPSAYANVSCLTKFVKDEVAAYIIYAMLDGYISIVRLGTVKKYRRRGHSKSVLLKLKSVANKKRLPIRTYIRYDNWPSYLLHVKNGFVPTHVAWKMWVWVEYEPKAKG